MTLTELRYIVAVARERHFGRAAEACFVSQPTLSVAIKKLEEELDVKIFERGGSEVSVTPLGEEIVRQAQSVLEQAGAIKEIAKRGKDPLAGALRLGIIYTIGPYLLPELVKHTIERYPQMPLMLQENFTVKLLEMLRTGELDCAIMAEPFPDTGLAIAPLYDEPFVVAVPATHPLASASHQRRGAQARDHAAAGHRPLLPRPCAGGLPRVRALLQRRRGHPPQLRGLVAGDHQAHGGLGHGRDGGAGPQRAGEPRRTCATCPSATPSPRAAWCWPGGAASRATRPSRRCATPSTPASWTA
jgi:DNA-binding transcriptional LysR family regulator